MNFNTDDLSATLLKSGAYAAAGFVLASSVSGITALPAAVSCFLLPVAEKVSQIGMDVLVKNNWYPLSNATKKPFQMTFTLLAPVMFTWCLGLALNPIAAVVTQLAAVGAFELAHRSGILTLKPVFST